VLDNNNTNDYSHKVGEKRMINEIDTQILNIIQQDARISNAEIARQVELAPSAVLERVRKLEERGVIRGYAAEIDATQVGFGLTAFVFVRTSDRCGGTDTVLAKIPEVLEVHDVAGEDCYLLKVRAKDTDELGKLLREKLGMLPEVLSTRTTVVLQTVKETTALPLENLSEDAGEKARRKLRKAAKSNLKKKRFTGMKGIKGMDRD